MPTLPTVVENGICSNANLAISVETGTATVGRLLASCSVARTWAPRVTSCHWNVLRIGHPSHAERALCGLDDSTARGQWENIRPAPRVQPPNRIATEPGGLSCYTFPVWSLCLHGVGRHVPFAVSTLYQFTNTAHVTCAVARGCRVRCIST